MADMQSRRIVSTVKSDGTLQLSIQSATVREPGEDEIVVRMEASPINPSDIAVMFSAADPSTVQTSGPADNPVATLQIPEKFHSALAAMVDTPVPVGNEGAGVVVAAGSSDAAQKLMGKTVSMMGRGQYCEHKCVKADSVLVMLDGTTPRQAASSFVNPLTALGFLETLRMADQKALVHTAAASNLGQMLNRICQTDGFDLVNIVRSKEQVELLRGMGARYVINSSDADFRAQLTDAIAETGAMTAFDALGGGRMANTILACMEAAAARTAPMSGNYGSNVFKKLYIYGRLDVSPLEIISNYGFSWGVEGWLMPPTLAKLTPSRVAELRQRVADEITTSFASHYSEEVSLAGALSSDAIKAYTQRATGRKFLIIPSL